MNKMKRLTGRKILLVAVALCAFGFAKAQDTQMEKNTLTLTLDKALEIALDENPTMKVQSPNQKIPDRKTKCVIKTHINIKQNVIFGAKLKPV